MERTLADLIAHAPVFLRQIDGEILHWPVGAEELYGYSADEAVGRRSHELLKTEFPVPLDDINARMLSAGEWRGRLQHCSKDGRRIWTESLWRARSPSAPHPLVVEQNTDVSDRVRAEHQRELLALELDHRVKNTLAVVQGIAQMTFATADRPVLQIFNERLIALSKAHDVLMREGWEGAELSQVLDDVVEALNIAARVTRTGPPAHLTPNSTVAYALAFHELATNAIKHGALSTAEGGVEVTWQRLPDDTGPDRIRLTWREHGGPRVSPPSRQGFGTRLIRRAVAAELGAPVELRFEPDGLICQVVGPLQTDPLGLADGA